MSARGGKPSTEYSKLKVSSAEADDLDGSVDEHGEFTRSVQEFRSTLLHQFKVQFKVRSRGESSPREFVLASEEEADQEDLEYSDSMTPALNIGEEPYIARFVSPFPARPIWTSVLPPSSSSFLPPPTSADDSNAPRVAIAFRYMTPEQKAWVDSALFTLISHPAGLMVSVCPELWESAEQPQKPRELILFVAIGLKHEAQGLMRQTTTARPVWRNLLPGELASLTTAEQREIIWKAVHQALHDGHDGPLNAKTSPLREVFMLQDPWLYDRLFQWLTKKQAENFCKRPLGVLSQEELDLIVHEFGEVTATHFLFVDAYVHHLWIAAVVTLACFLVAHIVRGEFAGSSGTMGESPMERAPWTFLAAFFPMWAYHFMASWRAKTSTAGLRWLGSLGLVQNSMMETAMLEALETRAQKRARYFRVLVLAVPLLFFQLLVVLGVNIMFVCLEVYIYDVIWEQFSWGWQVVATAVYNVAFGLAFMVMLGTFHPISKMVTQWERHPGAELVEWHLTMKLILNWFFAIFLYFFVIAFCYIPFGDHVAHWLAALRTNPITDFLDFLAVQGSNETASRLLIEEEVSFHPIQEALEKFSPDVHRLAYDVFLFSFLQDLLRLLQVLYPAARATYGSRHGSSSRHKKRARFHSEVLQMLRIVFSRSPLPICRVPCTPHLKMMEKSRDQEGIFVAYVLIQDVSLLPGRSDSALEGKPMLITCSLAGSRDSPTVCTPLRRASSSLATKSMGHRTSAPAPFLRRTSSGIEVGGQEMDVITLTCDVATVRANKGVTVRMAIAMSDFSSKLRAGPEKSSWTVEFELPLDCEVTTLPPPKGAYAATAKALEVGPMRVQIKAGMIGASTHHEAMDIVAGALRCSLRDERPPRPSSMPSLRKMRTAESLEMADAGGVPWNWWDQELSGIFWDGVAELYAAKDTFDTFEIYGHLTTQFCYVCFFSISVPVLPILALMFVSMEVRQDQLRLLWLSRPPKPDSEMLRFKPGVSLGAWRDFFEFTCHLSVIVNMLLWGLTYQGTGATKPSDWTALEWWHAFALFMLCEKVAGWSSRFLSKYVSHLDHDTAQAYLRREMRLQRALATRDEDAAPSSSRQLSLVHSRRAINE